MLHYFTCSRKEKNAAILLGLVLLSLQGVIWYRHFSHPPAEYTLGDKEQQAWQQLKKSSSSSEKKTADVATKELPDLKPFNPNHPDEEGYMRLGLSRRQAAALIRYRERTGGFYTYTDLEKVRVLPAELLRKWRPALVFETKEERKLEMRKKDSVNTHRFSRIDINRADTVTLSALPLIGPGRARAIVRYRDRLGGFYDPAQLHEIRIMPDSVVMAITPMIHTGDGVFRKIDVNRDDSIIHPYLNKQMVRLMVNYRQQNGFFSSTEDLRPLPLFDEEIIRKIAPYLIFTQ